jgi:hypothetical protein
MFCRQRLIHSLTRVLNVVERELTALNRNHVSVVKHLQLPFVVVENGCDTEHLGYDLNRVTR